MCSSEVMLRINSSESSGLSDGPSTRCRMPCTRMVGGVPTRICKSEAPSDTTNCNKSDMEYDMKSLNYYIIKSVKRVKPVIFIISFTLFDQSLIQPSRFVADRRTNDFLR